MMKSGASQSRWKSGSKLDAETTQITAASNTLPSFSWANDCVPPSLDRAFTEGTLDKSSDFLERKEDYDVEMHEVESACLEGKCEENVTTAVTSLQGRDDDTVMLESASVSIGDSNVEVDAVNEPEKAVHPETQSDVVMSEPVPIGHSHAETDDIKVSNATFKLQSSKTRLRSLQGDYECRRPEGHELLLQVPVADDDDVYLEGSTRATTPEDLSMVDL
jgi:hypothetical protein